ncbi:MAG TPA: carbohydrate kinase family protein [Chloroflexota bacterium]|nr:carbohydrate kinase family protein [Chloroflexota bacterium]
MTGARDLDVVVVCEINVDIVVTGLAGPPVFGAERVIDDVMLTAGGSGVLTATGLADLGLRVGVCGLVGDDPFGRFMLEHCDRHGIDRRGVVVGSAERTGASILLSTNVDRAILTHTGSMARFGYDQINFDVVRRARHLHLSSYFLQAALRPSVPDLLAHARSLGLGASADTGHDPEERWDVDDLLPGLDVFLPNEVEALAITGAHTPVDALARLGRRVPLVAVKRGAAGAIAARGAEQVRAPGFEVRTVDTTGAGDAFDAGFLHALLGGADLETSLRRGNACGALTAAQVGGTGALSLAAVEAMLRGCSL